MRLQEVKLKTAKVGAAKAHEIEGDAGNDDNVPNACRRKACSIAVCSTLWQSELCVLLGFEVITINAIKYSF